MAEPEAPIPYPDRTCGDCDLCCKAMGIDEIDKPMAMRCPFQKTDGPGCAIYGKHPPTCQAFRCAWRDGLFPEEFKPNKIGLLLFGHPEDERVPVAHVDHERPNSWREAEGLALLTALSSGFSIMVGCGGKLVAYVPRGGNMSYTREKSPWVFAGDQAISKSYLPS